MFKVLSNLRCLRADRSDVVSESSSLSLLSLSLSRSRDGFFTGDCLQSVRQDTLSTKAARVNTRPMHTPETKYRAARSGFSRRRSRKDSQRQTMRSNDTITQPCCTCTNYFSSLIFPWLLGGPSTTSIAVSPQQMSRGRTVPKAHKPWSI